MNFPSLKTLGTDLLKSRPALVVLAAAQILITAVAHGESSTMIGSWKIEIAFANGESRSFQFDAQGGGKGSLLLFDAQSKALGTGKASEAKWTQVEGNSVAISGPVEFPLGNVGLLRGTLVLKGEGGFEGSITGEAKFFLIDQDPQDPSAKPTKSGTFKATRLAR
ncbi:MAG: hypothetical protein M3Q46_01940 [Verrucomicrobiota bacterium]|nr:hypothetical protein [Verrucomicrobiota bacterium]